MPEENRARRGDATLILRVCLCLFLGFVLFLFIRNNDLLAHGGRNLRDPQALIMLAVLGIPFLLSVLHLIRGFSHQQLSDE